MAAVLAIAGALEWRDALLARISRHGTPRLFHRWFLPAVYVAGAALLGTAPLLLHHFARVQPMALVSSIVLVPLVSMAVPLGLLVVLSGLVSQWLASAFGETLSLVLAAMSFLARFFGRQTWAMVAPGVLSWFGVAWAYLLMVLAWNWRKRETRFWTLAVLLVGLNWYAWKNAAGASPTRAVFLDPGAGDAVLLEDSLGRKVLVDAGIDRRRVLRDYLRARGVRRLELAVVTHPDLDHYGGLLDIVGWCRVGKLLVATTEGSEVYRSLLDDLGEAGTDVVVAGQGTSVSGFGWGIEFTWPPPVARRLHRRGMVSSNEVSLVARAEHAGFSMLLTGDLDDPAMLAALPAKDVDLLKSPHHGSRSGNPPELFEDASPDYVVVMGRYPTPAGLATRLSGMGDRYVNTRRDGAWQLVFGRAGVRATHCCPGASRPVRRR